MVKYHMYLASPVSMELAVEKDDADEALEFAKSVFGAVVDHLDVPNLTRDALNDFLEQCSWGSNGYNRVAECNSDFDLMLYWTEE